MKLSLEAITAYYRIHSYNDDKVVIRTKNNTELVEITTSFILMPEQLLTQSLVSNLYQLSDKDIAYLINLGPEVILFASGSTDLSIFPLLISKFSQYGIGVELMSFAAAYRTYNLLLNEDRKVMLVASFD